MKIAFQMEPMAETERGSGNAVVLIEEAVRRGHDVYHYLMDDLSLSSDGVFALAAPVSVDLSREDYYTLGDYERVDLGHFDVVFLRQVPPVDMRYMTFLYIIDQLKKQNVLVTNDPAGILMTPEKLSIFDFPEHMPPTLVSRDKGAIERFFDRYGEIVVKPLYEYYGLGIIRTNDVTEVYSMLDSDESFLMFQAFLPDIKAGKKRVILFDGEIAAVAEKRPENGDFLTPASLPYVRCELTDVDKDVCRAVASRMKEAGLHFVGLDLVGGKLIEINNTCVGSLRAINSAYGISLQAQLWDLLEGKVADLRCL